MRVLILHNTKQIQDTRALSLHCYTCQSLYMCSSRHSLHNQTQSDKSLRNMHKSYKSVVVCWKASSTACARLQLTQRMKVGMTHDWIGQDSRVVQHAKALYHYDKRNPCSCTHILAKAYAFNQTCKVDSYPVHCWKVVLKADSTSWGQYFFENMVPQGFLHCDAIWPASTRSFHSLSTSFLPRTYSRFFLACKAVRPGSLFMAVQMPQWKQILDGRSCWTLELYWLTSQGRGTNRYTRINHNDNPSIIELTLIWI